MQRGEAVFEKQLYVVVTPKPVLPLLVFRTVRSPGVDPSLRNIHASNPNLEDNSRS
jgi:hypothetical protein